MRLTKAYPAVLLLVLLVFAGCVSPPSSTQVPSGIPQKILTPPTPSTSSQSLGTRLLADARGFVYRVRSVACLVTGSSFASSAGIITNRHVAGGSSSLELSTWAGTDFSTDVEAISEGPDLALLSASAARPRPTIDTSAQSVGTQVWAAGYPEGDQLAVTPGKVVRYVDGAQFDEPGQIMEITNAIQHGNSGGPLLDDHDKVVGVVFAIDTLNNYGLAIPASTLAAFMSSPGNNTTSPCADVTETGNTGVGNTGTGDTASGAVNVGAVSGSPFAAPVQQTLETYFEGIDARDFTAAYSAYSARFQGSLSETSFATADGTSTISSVSVSSVVAQMNDDLKADVTFTSVQAAQDGPVPGQTCTNWSLEYILVPAPAGNPLSYLIDSVAPISAGHTAC